MQSKADLHVHSKYSNRPSEWILRRMGAPESFVEPREVYRRARAKGMDFVTISDHNTLAGALEISDLPGTFLSTELTTYFPESGCKIHVLVHDLTEVQFKEANVLRENIYDLQRYLRQAGILHTVAHPLFAVNDLLMADEVEKLLLMFERFEVLNGTRHNRANRLAEVILSSLTPECIEALADKHGIEPVGANPCRKLMTGGSDDHSGVYIASAHTVTPAADSVSDFLRHLRLGTHMHGGSAGTSLRLAHSFYHIGYSYYKDRFLGGSKGNSRLLESILKQMAGEVAVPPARTGRVPQAFGGLVGKIVRRWKTRRLNPLERTLVDEFSSLFQPSRAPRVPESENDSGPAGSDQCTFELACRMTHRVGYHFLEHFTAHLKNASLLESLQTVSALGPVALSITPYLAAFRTQHKDEALLREFTARFAVADSLSLLRPRAAWVTDALAGLDNDIVRAARAALREPGSCHRNITIITCQEKAPQVDGIECVNFAPVGKFAMPEYGERQLAFPPFLNIVEYLERERYEEIVIATPGPVGLAALAAAKLLGLKTTGFYHTDYSEQVGEVTEDQSLKQLAWRYMSWFYAQVDQITVVPRMGCLENLVKAGLDERKIRIVPLSGIENAPGGPVKSDLSASAFAPVYSAHPDLKDETKNEHYTCV